MVGECVRSNHVVICLSRTYRDYLDNGSLSKASKSKQNIEVSKQIHTVYFLIIWPK